MGGFKKLVKAVTRPIIKLVDHVVPGGRYLTGSEQSRQKNLYNAALNEHNNYATQAQSNMGVLRDRIGDDIMIKK